MFRDVSLFRSVFTSFESVESWGTPFASSHCLRLTAGKGKMMQASGSLPVSIPFNRPHLTGREWQYVQDSFARGHISGDGYYTMSCHQFLEKCTNSLKSLLTTSCTHALEMAALLLDIEPGDEVIVPSFTFVSTANAFALRGAKIVFSDIRPDTLNIDDANLERLISGRTRAVVPVHYAGVPCA